MRRGVRFCECEVEFRFERLTEKYIRLAVSSKWALPEVQRGYLVTTDELATELDAAIGRFLSEVDAEGPIENNPAEGLHRQRDEFAEAYL
jgi:hypothetical protein